MQTRSVLGWLAVFACAVASQSHVHVDDVVSENEFGELAQEPVVQEPAKGEDTCTKCRKPFNAFMHPLTAITCLAANLLSCPTPGTPAETPAAIQTANVSTHPSERYLHWMANTSLAAAPVSAQAILDQVLRNASTSGLDWSRVKPKQYCFVLVPGLFSKMYGKGYFAGNLATLKELGVDASIADIDTTATVEHNGLIIAKFILAAGQRTNKKVVVVAQSKGVCDVMETLAQHPEVRKIVHRVVAIQGVMGGSPLATDYMIGDKQGMLKAIGNLLKSLTPGFQLSSFSDMGYKRRLEWQTSRSLPLEVLQKTLSISTHVTRPDSLLALPAQYMSWVYGIQSDGLVPTESAYVPGSYRAVVGDMDHADTVFQMVSIYLNGAKYSCRMFTRAAVFAALLLPDSPAETPTDTTADPPTSLLVRSRFNSRSAR